MPCIERAIDLVGLTRLTEACGLASTNSLRKWRSSGKIPLDSPTDYPAIIEQVTEGRITRDQIWREQLADLRPGIVYRLPVSLLQPDRDQPRVQFDPEAISELAQSLKEDGQESPIKFRIEADSLVIKHGERRWRACQAGGIEHIYGVLDTVDETPAARILRQAADNTAQPLTPWDWACTLRRLADGGMGAQEISDELTKRGFRGFSRPAVSNYLRLHSLPQWAQEMIQTGWLTPSHGKYLLSIKHATVLAAMGNRYRPAAADAASTPPTINQLQDQIREAYLDLFPRVDGQPNQGSGYPRLPAFDPNDRCPECPHAHTITDATGTAAHTRVCTNSHCWEERHEEAAQAPKAATKDESISVAIGDIQATVRWTEHEANINGKFASHTGYSSLCTYPQVEGEARDAYARRMAREFFNRANPLPFLVGQEYKEHGWKPIMADHFPGRLVAHVPCWTGDAIRAELEAAGGAPIPDRVVEFYWWPASVGLTRVRKALAPLLEPYTRLASEALLAKLLKTSAALAGLSIAALTQDDQPTQPTSDTAPVAPMAPAAPPPTEEEPSDAQSPEPGGWPAGIQGGTWEAPGRSALIDHIRARIPETDAETLLSIVLWYAAAEDTNASANSESLRYFDEGRRRAPDATIRLAAQEILKSLETAALGQVSAWLTVPQETADDSQLDLLAEAEDAPL